MRRVGLSLLLASMLSLGCAAQSEAEQAAAGAVAAGADAPSELNARFVDPEMDVDEWIGRFEVESREVFAARDEVMAAVGLSAGDRIADIGAGTGFYTRLFSEAVGDGWVYAVDISPRFIEHINASAGRDGLQNVTGVLSRVDSVMLPPASVNHAFICDTYHHFDTPADTLASIHAALEPGGMLTVIDFERIEGVSSDWIMGHVRAGKEVFRAEIEAAGFAFVEEIEIEGFEQNYLLKFRRK
ncbi:SAM-dependent methyltransferase [Acidobacteria bacterium Mor1]|nr:SAM-dependent methyltransferase [Acidobacteria bacterium Mor1]